MLADPALSVPDPLPELPELEPPLLSPGTTPMPDSPGMDSGVFVAALLDVLLGVPLLVVVPPMDGSLPLACRLSRMTRLFVPSTVLLVAASLVYWYAFDP